MTNLLNGVNQRAVVMIGGAILVLLVLLFALPAPRSERAAEASADAAEVLGGGELGEVATATLNADSPFEIGAGYSRTFRGAVGAFDCNSAAYVGAIEPGRAYAMVEEDFGTGFTRLNIEGSGELCVLSRELYR